MHELIRPPNTCCQIPYTEVKHFPSPLGDAHVSRLSCLLLTTETRKQSQTKYTTFIAVSNLFLLVCRPGSKLFFHISHRLKRHKHHFGCFITNFTTSYTVKRSGDKRIISERMSVRPAKRAKEFLTSENNRQCTTAKIMWHTAAGCTNKTCHKVCLQEMNITEELISLPAAVCVSDCQASFMHFNEILENEMKNNHS